jgi:hypothetical protein
MARLAQAAAQFEGVFIDAAFRFGNAHLSQHLNGPGARLMFIAVAVQLNRFDNLVADGVHRAEGRHRLLENQANFGTANVADLLAVGVQLGQVGHLSIQAVQEDLAIHDTARRSTMRRIDWAVTLFPHPLSPTMPTRFPGVYVEGCAIDCLDDTFVLVEIGFQVLHR